MGMMKAAVFVAPGRIELGEKPIPAVGADDALIRITTTTICGTDVHILKGEYPAAPGLTVGHEPVGIIVKLGTNVRGYREGQRVIAGAICPSFTPTPARMAFRPRTAAACPTATNPWAAGASAIPSMALRPNFS
ncbi:MAG TPA: alcohol dehydrogenase catalytic domain-containing protein [Candidatus Macondimonas sp.]|nr:alcohol dehydrogenase catalytic domain-containing protein [Candidatus Macondimonas sp.]